MIGFGKHLLGPLYTVTITVSHIWRSELIFAQNEGFIFLLSKWKNWTFFSKIENGPLHGSHRSNIIGDEWTNPKAYFKELVMVVYILNLKKIFLRYFIIYNKESCIIVRYPVPWDTPLSYRTGAPVPWDRVVSPHQLYHPLFLKLFKLRFLNLAKN